MSLLFSILFLSFILGIIEEQCGIYNHKDFYFVTDFILLVSGFLMFFKRFNLLFGNLFVGSVITYISLLSGIMGVDYIYVFFNSLYIKTFYFYVIAFVISFFVVNILALYFINRGVGKYIGKIKIAVITVAACSTLIYLLTFFNLSFDKVLPPILLFMISFLLLTGSTYCAKFIVMLKTMHLN